MFLYQYEAHVKSISGVINWLNINNIVLVCFDVGINKLMRHKFHGMPKLVLQFNNAPLQKAQCKCSNLHLEDYF
jgi:hypothetical protein